MARKHWRILFAAGCLGASWATTSMVVSAQGQPTQESSRESQTSQEANLQALGELIRQLQGQVGELNQQMKELRSEQANEREQNAQLHKELDETKTQLALLTGVRAHGKSGQDAGSHSPSVVTEGTKAENQAGVQERITRIEENQQLTEGKLDELNQTRVESSSKYRLRLSGIVLLNLYSNRGAVDNQDIPQIATPRTYLASDGTFGGSLRQSQIGLEGFGPELWGARTSANIRFDFAGGFPGTPNGTTQGFARLRTGVVRLDWKDTSIIAGQDTLFISPLSPTSIASLAVPALAYSGNLWSWAPQIRVEHTIHFSDRSRLLVQGGLLDNLSGDVPQMEYVRRATWGEQSGQPAYAVRVAWTQDFLGREMTVGAGGYYGRQYWGLGRTVDAWAGTTDLALPLGKVVELDAQFYRGRAAGGLGGGIGQSVIWSGPLLSPSTEVYGLNSIGGWGQLKLKLTPKFEVNGAFGQDNPYADQLRRFGGNTGYYGEILSKNITPMVNFLYQPRSDMVMSVEYRYLKTYALDNGTNSANRITMSLGYIF